MIRFPVSLLLFGLLAASAGAQVTTNTALPIHDGELLVRELSFYRRASGDPGPMNRELSVGGSATVAAYGVTERLALFGVLPLLAKRLELTTPAGRVSRNASGPGDATLFARYSALQWDKPGETIRVAPLLGVETPTGRDDQRDRLGRLPQPLQLGSGSWDPLGGVVFTWQTFDWQFDATARYKANTRANGFEFGDEARLDMSLKRRLLPRELGEGVPAFLYGVLESNLSWNARNSILGRNDPDSGGSGWSLTPGFQYITLRWVVEMAVQVPVIQNRNGRGLEDDYAVYFGIRLNF